MYEGIVSKCFDWDYAPASELCGSRRVYFNVTQEGSSDVETLQELNLVPLTKFFAP